MVSDDSLAVFASVWCEGSHNMLNMYKCWYFCLQCLCQLFNQFTTILKYILVYLHKREDKIWLPAIHPKKISTYKLSIESIQGLSSIEMTVKEKVLSKLHKKSYQCDELEIIDFNTCSQRFLKIYYKENLKCSLPGLLITVIFK